MHGEYRFLRTHHGITRFVKVVVEAEPSNDWQVFLGTSLINLPQDYAHALRRGASLAKLYHERRSGQMYHIQIERIVEVPVDTSIDAVQCAAAAAVWKALGHDESDITMTFSDDQWHAIFDE